MIKVTCYRLPSATVEVYNKIKSIQMRLYSLWAALLQVNSGPLALRSTKEELLDEWVDWKPQQRPKHSPSSGKDRCLGRLRSRSRSPKRIRKVATVTKVLKVSRSSTGGQGLAGFRRSFGLLLSSSQNQLPRKSWPSWLGLARPGMTGTRTG